MFFLLQYEAFETSLVGNSFHLDLGDKLTLWVTVTYAEGSMTEGDAVKVVSLYKFTRKI